MTTAIDMDHMVYAAFCREYDQGMEYKHLRFGQAFYNFAKLHKCSLTGHPNAAELLNDFDKLHCTTDRGEAEALIVKIVNFN